MPKPALVVCVSDIHVNSTAGLLPPKVRRDDGSTHLANDSQLWLWAQWLDLWRHVRKLKRRLGARCIVVFNGDGPDRNRHSGGYDLIVVSRDDIVKWTVAVLEPAAKVADTLIINRGTPAHEGGTSELAELVGSEMKKSVTPDPETGNYSWWYPNLDVDGKLFIFGHRPPHNTRLENTRNAGAKRTAFGQWAARMRMGDPIPDVMVYSHVHHIEQGEHNGLYVYYTGAWKLCDAYGHSAGYSGTLEPVMAWLFTVRDGQIAAEPWKRNPPSIKSVKV